MKLGLPGHHRVAHQSVTTGRCTSRRGARTGDAAWKGKLQELEGQRDELGGEEELRESFLHCKTVIGIGIEVGPLLPASQDKPGTRLTCWALPHSKVLGRSEKMKPARNVAWVEEGRNLQEGGKHMIIRLQHEKVGA